ncbi:MAG: DUF4012 domain-containing protein [Candidatus Falkowbacteria bacterium]|nr:MAG: DUF4012 domain-containing protein [Candidatus Falkowbacteria bacterium]
MKIASLSLKLIKYLVIAGVLALIALIIIIVSSFKELKSAAASGLSAKSSLEAAAVAVQNKNWPEAQNKAESASMEINSALLELEKVRNKQAFNQIVLLRNQINDLEYLLKTADIISRSLIGAVPIAEKFSNLYADSSGYNFSSLNEQKKADFFKLIKESEPELNGLRANLDLALINLNKIHKIGVLWPIYGKLSDLKFELTQAKNLIEEANPLLKLLPALAGYPQESNFLIIMHNNDELRPSGGFIGVFGFLKTKNGNIADLKTDDSYHLDMPAVGKWKMTPPVPVSKYMGVENWYLRDSNWSPDWPTASKKIQEIFIGESRAVGLDVPAINGVIGITPDFVSDLLRLVGPITVKGETYTPENLQTLLQYNVEVAYKEQDISSWDRKAVINELLDELKTRLLSLETNKLGSLANIFTANIQNKNVQIYFNDSGSESLVYDLGADGAIKKTTSDYLMVVDANLGAFKSDSVVKKGITYNLKNNGGTADANLSLSYRHEGGFDWRTTRYRSYTRVLVPLGSKLISLKGDVNTKLDQESISSSDDSDLQKTVFGFFFSVEPGTAGVINLEYSLPSNISSDLKARTYQLFVQKQAGRRTESFKANINGEVYTPSLDKDLTIIP